MKIKLGQRYRDKVSGFEGVATSRTEFLYGCERVGLEALVGGDVKSFSFDAPGLEKVSEPPVVRPTQEERRTGGERPTPTRMAK